MLGVSVQCNTILVFNSFEFCLSFSILIIPVHVFLMLHSLRYCFYPFLSLKWERQRVIMFWTLIISWWNKNSLFYESSLKNVVKKMNLPNDKKVCRLHLVVLFDIFYWLCYFCTVYTENKYLFDPLYFPQRFTYPNSRFPMGEKIRQCHGIFTKIVIWSLGMSRDFFFKSPEHPDFTPAFNNSRRFV